MQTNQTNIIDFVLDLKKEIRELGRTNVLQVSKIEKLLIKHNINKIELEKLKNDMRK